LQNKSNYPREYQAFMEKIGPVSLGDGYQVISMDKPTPSGVIPIEDPLDSEMTPTEVARQCNYRDDHF